MSRIVSPPPDGDISLDPRRLEQALACSRETLLGTRNAGGYWSGELSSSALSTATAVVALSLAVRHGQLPDATAIPLVQRALDWLVNHQNPDGGWGDTTLSRSNLSTSTLVWAAMAVNPAPAPSHQAGEIRAEAWLRERAGGLDPEVLAPAIIGRYGADRTFSVPILTMAALAGRLGSGSDVWRHVLPLPFELAALPQRWFAALRLPVVSYALPALIAIGYARHHHAPSTFPWIRWLRSAVKDRVFRLLNTLQPIHGGFLEATPLTSFVVMSLLASGASAHPVVRRGLGFLVESARPDGSWPIDTHLATWVTSLSLHALSPEGSTPLDPAGRRQVREWLLGQQYRVRHPYTGAAPGGWAWTDLPGGVPDADDTPGALLALRAVTEPEDAKRSLDAATAGVIWLLDLQNSDGGVPTFCRGWGKLPFDRSSADLTAHALRAWHAWHRDLPLALQRRLKRATNRAVRFLERIQDVDGAWTPLWFGNEAEPDEANRVYGTSRVLLALADTGLAPRAAARAVEWLLKMQKPDGGWSGGAADAPASIEESALALEALAAALGRFPSNPTALRPSITRATRWLVERVEDGTWTRPSPIGFYFAKLWYYERLYPVIFTVAALDRARRELAR